MIPSPFVKVDGLHDVDNTLNALENSMVGLEELLERASRDSDVLLKNLRKLKFGALSAINKSQTIVSDLEIIIAGNELTVDFLKSSNSKRIKLDDYFKRKEEKAKNYKSRSQNSRKCYTDIKSHRKSINRTYNGNTERSRNVNFIYDVTTNFLENRITSKQNLMNDKALKARLDTFDENRKLKTPTRKRDITPKTLLSKDEKLSKRDRRKSRNETRHGKSNRKDKAVRRERYSETEETAQQVNLDDNININIDYLNINENVVSDLIDEEESLISDILEDKAHTEIENDNQNQAQEVTNENERQNLESVCLETNVHLSKKIVDENQESTPEYLECTLNLRPEVDETDLPESFEAKDLSADIFGDSGSISVDLPECANRLHEMVSNDTDMPENSVDNAHLTAEMIADKENVTQSCGNELFDASSWGKINAKYTITNLDESSIVMSEIEDNLYLGTAILDDDGNVISGCELNDNLHLVTRVLDENGVTQILYMDNDNGKQYKYIFPNTNQQLFKD